MQDGEIQCNLKEAGIDEEKDTVSKALNPTGLFSRSPGTVPLFKRQHAEARLSFV